MTELNKVQLASVRIITGDLRRLVRFYEVLTGAIPQYLTDDFVELVTPSATVALSSPARVDFIQPNTPRPADNHTVIIEFLVTDTKALFAELISTFGEDFDVVQDPTLMPWGNVSALVRDPDGSLINLYTPVTADGHALQANRTPHVTAAC